MLHKVHQRVATVTVCLPFGAEEVQYSLFLELYLWKQLPAENIAMRALTVNQNWSCRWTVNKELKDTKTLCRAEGFHSFMLFWSVHLVYFTIWCDQWTVIAIKDQWNTGKQSIILHRQSFRIPHLNSAPTFASCVRLPPGDSVCVFPLWPTMLLWAGCSSAKLKVAHWHLAQSPFGIRLLRLILSTVL